MSSKDCLFLVADKRIQHVLKAYFSRDKWYLGLGCGEFMINPEKDIVALVGSNDPGTYTKGHEFMRLYLNKYSHAFVVLDEAWDNSPGKQKIVEDLTQRILQVGWSKDTFKVIVIQPELENWIWIDSKHVDDALGMAGGLRARDWLIENGMWKEQEDKPSDPKGAYERIIRYLKKPDSPSIYAKIVSKSSLAQCSDPAFGEIKKALRQWFPSQ